MDRPPLSQRSGSATFGRSKRLTGRKAFASLFAKGRSVRADGLALKFLPNGLKSTRFGCVVQRKVASKAVVRNRLKRWLREAFRLHQGRLPQGLDLVAVISQMPQPPTYQTVEKTWLRLCQQLQRLARP